MSEIRASSVLAKEIEIEVVGSDLSGMQFIEPAKIRSITRDGAIVHLENSLAPESELVVRNMQSGEEILARVVGILKGDAPGYSYGIALPRESEILRGVEFPPEKARKNLALICSVCKGVVAPCLLAIEEEVLEANECLSRHCTQCRMVTIWNKTDLVPADEMVAVPTELPSEMKDEKAKEIEARYAEKRASKRAAIKMAACIRYSGIETEVVCEDMSRGGFRFRSKAKYPQDVRLEAAVPYAKSGSNIFTPVRVIFCQALPDGEFRHGVAHIKTNKLTDWNR